MKAQMMFGPDFGWKEVIEELLMLSFCLLANSSGSPASFRNAFKHTYTSMSAFQLRSSEMIRSLLKDCKTKGKVGLYTKVGLVKQYLIIFPLLFLDRQSVTHV